MGTRMLQRRGTTAEWSAANPVLGDGELGYNRTTGEVRMGDGVTAWNSLPSTNIYIPKATLDTLYSPINAIPKSLVDAAGDLIVGSADNTVVRLGKGADGQYLSVVAGALTWITPPATDLSSRVAKTGDTMTGPLIIADSTALGTAQNNVREILRWGGNDSNGDSLVGRLKRNAAGTDWTTVDVELVRRVDVTEQSGLQFKASSVRSIGDLYEGGNRVYSSANPPPGAGTVVSVTGTYSVAAGVGVVLSNGTFTDTLPAAAANSGRVINIKNTGIGVITIASAGGTIDGQTTVVLNMQYASITVVSDGTNWFIL